MLQFLIFFQIERYNLLLDLIRKQLTELEKGIQGLVVMSADLEEIFNCVFDARVPAQWMKVRTRASIKITRGYPLCSRK